MTVYRLEAKVEKFDGGAENDIVYLEGNSTRLSGSDTINGGAGNDTFQVRNDEANLSANLLKGLNSIEVIDVTAATTKIALELDDRTVGQASGTLTVRFGANKMTLNTADVGDAGKVILDGTGLVTLRNFGGQHITVADDVDGRINAGDASYEDYLSGGTGDDALKGFTGDDELSGGAGDDTLDGGSGHDVLTGAAGDDSLLGGTGYDLISAGPGDDIVSGGAGSDAFVLADGEDLTITDFAIGDAHEVIDLRGVAGVASFDDLSIVQSGANTVVTAGAATVTLKGISAASVNERDFVFAGNALRALASVLSADPLFSITAAADNRTGTSGNDIFDLSGDRTKLSGSDKLNGGAGYDILRVQGANVGLSEKVVAGLTSIERIDVSGSTGKSEIHIDKRLVDQAEGDRLDIVYGATDLTVDTQLANGFGTIVLEGSGDVSVRNFGLQEFTLADGFDFNVSGGEGMEVIRGGSGNDKVAGDRADDILSGGAGRDTLAGGEENDDLSGEAGNDNLAGDAGDDTLAGGDGNDVLNGGDGRDLLTGGLGDDKIVGGAGGDTIRFGAGNDTVAGGAGGDQLVLEVKGGATTITDFDLTARIERIDLRGVGVTGMSGLKITDTPDGAQIKIGADTTILLKGIEKSDLKADQFLFKGQDPLLFKVSAGASIASVQALVDDAPAGAKIILAKGHYYWDEQLEITRGDITLKGAGSGQTIIHSTLPKNSNDGALLVTSTAFKERVDTLDATATVDATKITLNSVGDLKVGDMIYIGQDNDDAFLKTSGNTGLKFGAGGQHDINNWLREAIVEVTAISGNTLTISQKLPYTFTADKAVVYKMEMLENVGISGLTFTTDGKKANPNAFINENEAWNGVATVEFDQVRNSTVTDVTVDQARSIPFKFQRTFEVIGDKLTANGAHNKDSGDGYGLYLSEAFSNTFTHVTMKDVRHGVITSSFSAEHYNKVQVDFTNRDINFHGSADSRNTIILNKQVLEYGNSTEEWRALSPGLFPIHPKSTLDANSITAKYAVGGSREDKLYAIAAGGYLDGAAGGDQLTGGKGNDTIVGGLSADRLIGGAGTDRFIFNPGDGNDVIGDFKAGKGGDVIALKGYAIKSFGEMKLTQSGKATIVDLGNAGTITLNNVSKSKLTSANFKFETGTGAEKTFNFDSSVGIVVGTDGADFWSTTAGILTKKAAVIGGAGYDVLQVKAGFLTATTASFGKFTSVEALDLSNIKGNVKIDFTDAILSQATGKSLEMMVGDSTKASPVKLDIGAPKGGAELLLDGARTVQLASTREQVLHIEDRIGATVRGGDKADMIFGGAKADALSGGKGADKLWGGAGADKLTGGSGADTFGFAAITDSKVKTGKAAAADLITDFSSKDKDRIDLSFIDADTKAKGDQKFDFISGNAFGKHAGELRAVTVGNLTSIFGDVNGDGKADFQIDLTGKITLHQADLIL
ncbi:calcium-binding protein [Sphingomonas sp. ID0503]|uniref:calcium-binding protein n=1 Tax=Sphingomonas sp. ID0503 TaxID=3399691 RepID=UPI003AFA142D